MSITNLEALTRVIDHREIFHDEMLDLMRRIMNGEMSPVMMAAIVMGKGVLPPPATFDFGIVMVAMMVHFVLAIIYAFILGWIVSHWRMGIGLASGVGATFGPLIYLVNFYGIAPAAFPWFIEARNWVGLVSHVMFGLALGWSYGALAARRHD